MQQKAIEKLKAEMAASAASPYIQVIGNFLLNHLEANPQDAEKVLVAEKTIAKSVDAMAKEAEKVLVAEKTIAKSVDAMAKEAGKKKVGNVAVLTDAEGYAIVLKYFGIDGDPVAPPAPAPKPAPDPKPAVTASDDDDWDFEKMLE